MCSSTMQGEYRMWYKKPLSLNPPELRSSNKFFVPTGLFAYVKLLVMRNKFCHTGSLCFRIAETSCEL